MQKKDTAEKDKWFRNDSNSVWILEENPEFEKPVNWEEIVKECQKAQEALELDICSFDVRVQSVKDPKTKQNRNKCAFIILESNSASSFGEVTLRKYIETIPRLAMKKAQEYKIWNGIK